VIPHPIASSARPRAATHPSFRETLFIHADLRVESLARPSEHRFASSISAIDKHNRHLSAHVLGASVVRNPRRRGCRGALRKPPFRGEGRGGRGKQIAFGRSGARKLIAVKGNVCRSSERAGDTFAGRRTIVRPLNREIEIIHTRDGRHSKIVPDVPVHSERNIPA